MKSAIDIMFEYLRCAIYEPTNAVLDIESLPEEFQDLGRGLHYFVECTMDANTLAKALANGDLNVEIPRQTNELASSLKSLHASLRHLTWQADQIAKGDYSQKISFMGEFSNSFNIMVEQLAERQKKLENEIKITQKKSAALEQGATLLTTLIQYVPQQIFVVEENTRNVLLMNDAAKKEMDKSFDFLTSIMSCKSADGNSDMEQEMEVDYTYDGHLRYFAVKFYSMVWHGSNADIVVVNDISDAKVKMKELEKKAYIDAMTELYNRAYGMITIDKWLAEKKRFALVFVDLDRLKYVNDEYGHDEGDRYIINAGNALKEFSEDCMAFRLGGDEFMLLVPEIDYNEANATMNKLFEKFTKHPYLKNKKYSYSLSFGIVIVDIDNDLSSGDILKIADERMYENKRLKRMQRR